MSEQKDRKLGGYTIAILGGLGLAYYFFVRPRMLSWGTNPGETERQLPGDHFIKHPNMQFTRGVDIAAPPQAVWSWLAQMGREDTGFYGLDQFLEDTSPAPHTLKKDLPPLKAGLSLQNGMKILQVEEPQTLIFGGFSISHALGGKYDSTYLYTLEETAPGRTRLITRLRGYAGGPQGTLYNIVREPLDFAHTLLQFRTLSGLAESMKGDASATNITEEIPVPEEHKPQAKGA